MKVQHCYLQNMHNGLGLGPVSINSEQVFVPTTNFAMFHAGQPRVIHDYWGHFPAKLPFQWDGVGVSPFLHLAT